MTTATSNGTVTTGADIELAADTIWPFVIEQGQVTRDEVLKACKAAGLSTEAYQKAWAKLTNQVKVLTEVAREDGSKAFELKRGVKHLPTYADYLEQMAELQAPTKPRERFDHWYALTGHFLLTSPSLSSRPVLGNAAARRFERDWEGNLLMPAGNYAALFEEACGKPGTPDLGGARYRVEWDQQAVDPAVLITILNPVPPSRPGASGQGLTEIEALPAGTRIPWTATIPGTHCSPQQFATVLLAAGRWCGFSASAHKQGWGRFRPEFDPRPFEDAVALFAGEA